MLLEEQVPTHDFDPASCSGVTEAVVPEFEALLHLKYARAWSCFELARAPSVFGFACLRVYGKRLLHAEVRTPYTPPSATLLLSRVFCRSSE